MLLVGEPDNFSTQMPGLFLVFKGFATALHVRYGADEAARRNAS
jgi:hypothetical protein